MSINPKDFDMPVASFNPNPMKLGLFTDGLPDMPFEQVLDEAVKMGIQVLEIATGGYSCAPHLDMEKLLHSAEARKEFLHAIESRGLELYALNCSANAIGPGERWASHAPDVMNTFRLPSCWASSMWSRSPACRQAARTTRPSTGLPTLSRPK